MPQINRIRVNNVKYNFGLQYYDDFMMRFSGKNAIYDLANGGGKSLLMLLLMQNMIPNCTLDDKQPLEKLFRGDSPNTAIHSMVEWILEPCYQKDNYKYMLTGFCARKARGNSASENPAGEEQTRENESPSVTADRSFASIEYFNYVIFYREFGDNDIRNLPLTRENRRITYQELKDYLRGLEKSDFNVSVKIFDRKGDYQNFISGYGIYESEWEIIRGINKTEGHVRTYFESNYRTSRKVVEDLLIEEIIQKSYHSRLGMEDDDERMAKTLMDIKDKLIELSKKRGQMHSYDMQAEEIERFASELSDFENIYRNKKEQQNKLVNMLAMAKGRGKSAQKEEEQLTAAIERIDIEEAREQKLVDTAKILEQQLAFEELGALIKESEKEKDNIAKELSKLQDILTLKECAADYREYIGYKKQLDEITQIIDNRLRDHDDIVKEMHSLAALKKTLDEKERGTLSQSLEEARSLADNEKNRLKSLEEERDNVNSEVSKALGGIGLLKAEIADCESELSGRLNRDTVLVAESAGTELLKVQESLNAAGIEKNSRQARINECSEKLTACRIDMNRTEAGIELVSEEIAQLEAELHEEEDSSGLIAELKNVYSEDTLGGLLDATDRTLRKVMSQVRDVESRILKEENYLEAIRRGRYECSGEQYMRVKEYLERQYKEDAVTGAEWYAGLNPGQKRDINKRVPFVHYGFVIKNDFERVKEDIGLQELDGSYSIPVISENVLYDMKLEVNTELITFASKNLSFLTDIARLDTEIKKCGEKIEDLKNTLSHLKDREAVIRADYDFVLRENVRQSPDTGSIASILAKKREQLRQLTDERQKCIENEHMLEQRFDELKESATISEDEIRALSQRADELNMIKKLDGRISAYVAELREYEKKAEEGRQRLERLDADIEPVRTREEAYSLKASSLASRLDRLDIEWQSYEAYYTEDAVLPEDNYEAEELESRFAALRTIIENDAKDITDKEKLRNHFQASMDKCKRAIAYRGMSFEQVREALLEDADMDVRDEALMLVKAQLSQCNKTLAASEEKLESQRALFNRLDGSIAYGIHRIEEAYGSYEPFECANPQSFKQQHEALVTKMRGNRKQLINKQKLLQKDYADIRVMIKDMERIIRNSGVDVKNADIPENGAELSFKDYEATQEELERIIKQENRRKDAFAGRKAELVTRLRTLQADDLAAEFEKSLMPPGDEEECGQLIMQLKETKEYILLEKDRVAKSTEDMERIKDSFENRCLQTCINIKTELDRLPKLSTITLDGKVIPIIGMQIPYIKEELYKDRMSAYIDETVTAAESFRDADGRLQYIRNRLTWKRLFSVIVTDMNAIRVNLYKRERIKDQSRWLRYEEAVGSTGQSQGIYIQFLIAVINYISNINAPAQEASMLGKTIFIDNPFGAAKDIYIWEPIFKLLKTNHVQLIVPSRGATPAITGRFDVNYVLGQQVIDGRQQTVVVDYQSRVESDSLEYSRIEYEQQTLELV